MSLHDALIVLWLVIWILALGHELHNEKERR